MNSAEKYILDQPEPYKSILMHLQLIIEHRVPDVSLYYKYKIPFYYLKGKPFCYLNASPKKRYVDLGFWKGSALTLHKKHLVTEDRKMITSLRYRQPEEINAAVLTDVLQEAKSLY